MRSLLYAFLPGLLNPVHGNVVFSRSKLHAFHKRLVFFCGLPILEALHCLQGFVRLWKVLEGFGKFLEALEGSAGFAKFCKALGGFVGRS